MISMAQKKQTAKKKSIVKSEKVDALVISAPKDKRTKYLTWVLALTAMLFYANTYKNDYCLDDAMAITLNKTTQKGFAGIKDHLKQDFIYGFRQMKSKDVASSRWRPLSLITFSIEIGLWGNNKPQYSHVINFLLYAWIAVLLFRLFYKYLFKEIWFSFFAVLLYVIHPIHTEVVANIKSRDELLSLLFILFSILSLWRYFEVKKYRHLAASVIFFFVSMTSKENGLTFIAGIPLMVYFFTRAGKKTIINTGLVFLATSVFFLLVRNSIVPLSNLEESKDIMNNPYMHATIAEGLATKMYIMLYYVRLLVFPHPLSFDYSYNVIPYLNFSSAWVWLSILLYGGLTVYALRELKNKNLFSFCILMFLITISISSNFVIGIGGMMGERLLFIPSLFFCIALTKWGSMLVAWFYEKFSMKKLIVVLVIMLPVYALSAYKTITRNTDWKDQNHLNLVDLPKVPNSARVNNGVGGAYLTFSFDTSNTKVQRDSLVEKAFIYIKKAIDIYPKYDDAYLNLGLAYGTTNQFEKAEDNWNIVRGRNPNNPKFKEFDPYLAHNFLKIGLDYGGRKSYDSALAYLKKSTQYAIVRDSLYLSCWYNLGGLYYTLGNYEKSFEAMGRVMEINPDYMNARAGYKASEYNLNLKRSMQVLKPEGS